MPGHKPTAKQMANLKPFKKGQSGNPEGGRAHDPVAKAIRKLTSAQLEHVISLLSNKTLAEIKQIAEAKTTDALTVWIAAIIVNGVKKGDVFSMDKLMERILGKVKQDFRVGDPNGQAIVPNTVIVNIPSNGRERKT